MNLAVTMTAYRRPQHTRRALVALSHAARYAAVHPDVRLSLDYYDRCTQQDILASAYGGPRIRINNPPYGIWAQQNNQYHTYEWAFGDAAVDAVLAIEDDCVLSIDALDLCHWFLNSHFSSNYLFLSLANHNRTSRTTGSELDIVESTTIDSPWCWCFTRDAWQEIKPHWNRKTQDPVGWDWSLTYTMYRNGWKSLNPVLSRAKNIGREMATNSGAAVYDETWAKADWSDGTFGNNYQLQRSDEPLVWHRDWMDAEEAVEL